MGEYGSGKKRLEMEERCQQSIYSYKSRLCESPYSVALLVHEQLAINCERPQDSTDNLTLTLASADMQDTSGQLVDANKTAHCTI